MTALDEMWAALESHQPVADSMGYGKAWRKMCAERTEMAANAAVKAAWDVAAGNACEAAEAAVTVIGTVDWAKVAVEHFIGANKEAAK